MNCLIKYKKNFLVMTVEMLTSLNTAVVGVWRWGVLRVLRCLNWIILEY